MTNEQLEAKFRGLADDILGAEQSARLLALAWSIETLADAAEICRLSAPQARRQPRRA
jgi:hypothetical protein